MCGVGTFLVKELLIDHKWTMHLSLQGGQLKKGTKRVQKLGQLNDKYDAYVSYMKLL